MIRKIKKQLNFIAERKIITESNNISTILEVIEATLPLFLSVEQALLLEPVLMPKVHHHV